jgi:hypothetical protein
MESDMKHLITVLAAFALLGFAVPAFACGGDKANSEETTTTSTEKKEGDQEGEQKEEKKAKADTEKAEGEA